jgi:PLP dependent protein
MDRRTELSQNLAEVNNSISSACAKFGRSVDDVNLIVVTKTWPASDVDLLAELGVTDVGENRDQEAKPKHDEVQAKNLTWHAIGQLQTNKAKSVASWADVLHSVDRLDLVNALAKAVTVRTKPLKCLIQVNLESDPAAPGVTDHRGGAHPQLVKQLADQISLVPNLAVAGVMAVAPLGVDPEPAFKYLSEISAQLISDYPNAKWISAGMSGDFEVALKYGATHLRIGSSILGHRVLKG